MKLLVGAAAGFMATVFLLNATAAAAQGIGQVVKLEGAVTAERSDRSVTLHVGSAVFKQDTIATQSGSRLKIEFKNGSLLAIGEESRVALTKYTPVLAGGRIIVAIRLFIGIVRSTLPKGRPNGFEIHTRAAIASVRSTDWLVERTGDRTSVLAIEGRVWVEARPFRRWTVTVNPGLGIDFRDNDDAPQPTRWPAERVGRALERVRFQ